jgi:hypothetical protein
MWRLSVLGTIAFLGASVCGFASTAAVKVNGTCEVGNCANPDEVSNATLFSNFDFIYTFGNGDEYRIVGTFEAFDSGTSFSFSAPYNVLYLGPNGPSANDVLTIDILQNFDFTGSVCCGADLIVTFGNGLAAGTSDAGQTFFDGQSAGAQGPVSPPGHFSLSVSKSLTLTNPVLVDQTRVFTFGSGSLIGADIASGPAALIPEPSEIIPVCGILAALALARRIRARRRANA